MGCYLVPTIAAIIHFRLRKKIPSLKANKYQLWLNQLFLGGAIFGVVDHLWHGELFLLGEKPLMDLALGVVITVAIFAVWGLMVCIDEHTTKNTTKALN